MKYFALPVFLLFMFSTERLFAQTQIGVQNAELRIRFFGGARVITVQEKDTINQLRITLMMPASDPLHSWTGEVMLDTCVLNWAAGNGGTPTFGTLWPPNTSATYVDLPFDRWSPTLNKVWNYWNGTYPTTDTALFPSAPSSIPLSFRDGFFGFRRPRDFGKGGTDSAHYVDTVRMMISNVKSVYDKPGFGLMMLGVEEHEFNWRDWPYLRPDTPNHPMRVFPDSAEVAAKRWRQGMNFAAKTVADSLTYGKSFYLEEGAFVIGFGGTPNNYDNWDTWLRLMQPPSWAPERDPDYYCGADGLPDTLFRISEYFEDMWAMQYHGVQLYPFTKNTDSTSAQQTQFGLGYVDHNWRAMAAGISSARRKNRSYLASLSSPTGADSQAHPIPVTKLLSLIQAQANYAPWGNRNNGGNRYPTQTELRCLAGIGFSCGVRTPVYYMYDRWGDLDTSEQIRLRDMVTDPIYGVNHFTNDTLYPRIKWLNDSIYQVFLPVMDTLEYYDGFTTMFGTRYGDQRPFGGGDSVRLGSTRYKIVGWHIRGHEYLDSLIATHGSDTDRISTDSAVGWQWDSCRNRVDSIYVGRHVDYSHGTYVSVGLFHPEIPGRNDVDTSREYLFVLNRRTESGGERSISLVLDRSKRPAWTHFAGLKITNVVTGEKFVRPWHHVTYSYGDRYGDMDTLHFTDQFDRAQGKLYFIEPTNTTFEAAGDETMWNNGRRMEYDGSYHLTYRRQGHVYYAKTPAQSASDPLMSKYYEHRLDTLLDSAKHPTIRTASGVVGIVYEGFKDTLEYIKLTYNLYNGDSTVPWVTVVVDSFRIDSAYEATPVLCRFIKSWRNLVDELAIGGIVAWSRGTGGINLRPCELYNSAVTAGLGQIVTYHAQGGGVPSLFPTIMERGLPEDSVELAFQEPQGSHWEIWHVRPKLGLDMSSHVSIYFDTPVECVSRNVHSGCNNLHPNIDVSHTTPYGYVPRLVWEGDEPVYASDGHLTSKRTYIYTAARIDSGLTSNLGNGWTNYQKFYTPAIFNQHPSVRVFQSDTVVDYWWNMFVAGDSNRMLWKGKISMYDTLIIWQPTAIGWYDETDSLYMAKTYDALPSRVSKCGTWVINHLGSGGTHPTLEINGRTKDYWVNQRDLHLEPDKSHIAIPLIASEHAGTPVPYGQVVITGGQNCSSGGIDPRTSVMLGWSDTTHGIHTEGFKLLQFHSSSDPKFIGRVVHSEDVPLSPVQDTVLYIMQVSTGDTMALRSKLGLHGSLRYSLTLRLSYNDSILKYLDTIVLAAGRLRPRSDTVISPLSAYDGMTVYFCLAVDTVRVTGLHVGGYAVVKEDIPDSAGRPDLAKAATQSGGRFGDVVMPSNPIDLTIYPNPAMMGSRPTVQYTIPVEDANDVAEVRVWDINGKDVSTLVHDVKSAGRHEVTFDGTKLPTGRYIVAVHLRTHQQSKMVNLVR